MVIKQSSDVKFEDVARLFSIPADAVNVEIRGPSSDANGKFFWANWDREIGSIERIVDSLSDLAAKELAAMGVNATGRAVGDIVFRQLYKGYQELELERWKAAHPEQA